MDELFIYEKEKGLFKKVIEQSFVLEGRYHVSSSNGQDLNSNNLDTLNSALPDKKYPRCVCLTPESRLGLTNGQQTEKFYFTLLFLTSTYYNSDGSPKDPDANTGISTHEVWYDWKDMKKCAADFVTVLDKVTKMKLLANGKRIASEFNIDLESINVRRLSKFGEDRVSGVAIVLPCNLFGADCLADDYPADVLDNIITPDEDVHPQHKHL